MVTASCTKSGQRDWWCSTHDESEVKWSPTKNHEIISIEFFKFSIKSTKFSSLKQRILFYRFRMNFYSWLRNLISRFCFLLIPVERNFNWSSWTRFLLLMFPVSALGASLSCWDSSLVPWEILHLDRRSFVVGTTTASWCFSSLRSAERKILSFEIYTHLTDSYLFLHMLFMFDTTNFLRVSILNLLLQAARAAFTRFKPISENCHDLLNVFSLNISRHCVINLQLAVLLI